MTAGNMHSNHKHMYGAGLDRLPCLPTLNRVTSEEHDQDVGLQIEEITAAI